MKPSLSKELALDALLMAVWRRKPTGRVVVHSDQGSQYGSDDFKRFCQDHNLEPSMSRRANCWDNAVAESFFSTLKKERIRKRIYKTRSRPRRQSSIILGLPQSSPPPQKSRRHQPRDVRKRRGVRLGNVC